MRILVIEDNPDIKEVLDYILEDDGHEVIPCSDGSSLSTLDQLKPDVILMDDILPGVRGRELCLRLKNDEATKHIPVVLTSATSNLKRTAEACKADAYLEKPFNIDQLIDIVKSFAKR